MSGGSGPEPHVHVVRFAPAKLNLTLAVTGRRADGFHALHSIMVTLSLGDALTVRIAGPSATCDSIRVTGLAIPEEPDNLVLRAIAGARELVTRELAAAGATAPAAAGAEWSEPRPEPVASFLVTRLNKRIPVAAGLGGGSSDAVAAVDAALAAWGATLPESAIDSLAASLGSDVPFFRAGGAAVVTGRGEFVEPLPPLDDPPAVLLVTPRLHVSTAAVFRAYAAGHRSSSDAAFHVSETLAEALRLNPSPSSLLDRAADLAVANDLALAAAATAPGLADFAAALGREIGRPVCQSGSGPTLWALYAGLAEAETAAQIVRGAIAATTLPSVGEGEPFVTATTISTPSHASGASPQVPGAMSPVTVHNGTR